MRLVGGLGRLPRPALYAKICGAVAGLSISAIAIILVLGFRGHELASAGREISALDVVLAETSSQAFSTVAMVLDRIVEDVGTDQISTPQDFRPRLTGFDVHECLKMRAAGIARYATVLMFDANGDLVSHSKRWPTPEINVADRDYYRHARDNAGAEPYVSEPIQNKITGRWVVQVTRRFDAKDGGFAGVIVGAMELDYFQDLYANMRLPKGHAVSLWRNDGTLLARSPADVAVGIRYETEALRIIQSGQTSGLYETAQAPDGKARIAGVHAARDFPVFVTTSVTLSAALADWRSMLVIVAVAAGMALIATLAISFAAVRQLNLYEELTQALKARDESEAQVRQLQKMDALGQLTGGIAHDFNNMLAIVKGNIDLLRRRLDQGRRDVGSYLDAADDGVVRAADLTRRLLAFSRREPVRAEAVEPNAFVESLTELFRRTFSQGLILETDLGRSPPFVKVDPGQFENAILNLAINARDAMPDGGTVSIRTRTARGADTGIAGVDPQAAFAVVEVADTGSGMTPEVLAKIFEPFFTTKPVGKGTGLGLPQVFAFADAAGGRVQVESQVGRGTRVRIYLPSTDERPAGHVEHGPAPVATGGQTILVVDDEEAVRTLSCEMLRNLGYAVLTAADGEEALAILDGASGVELVITDLGMPGMGGVRFAQEALRLHPGLRILYATGSGHEGPVAANDVEPTILAKPYSTVELARSVQAALAA
jgi:two-component system NtrC family sensor kinase